MSRARNEVSVIILVAGCAGLVLTSLPAYAQEDTLQAAQSKTAQVVVVARVAAILCSGVEVDEDAVRALMDHAQTTDSDIMSPDRFGPEDEAAARSFKQSMAEDPQFCGKMLAELADRLHLVRRR